MNYQQAYDFIISLNNIPRQEYLKNKKKSGIYLKRTQLLLDILGNPEKRIPHYIHVTGTSGKGSVCLLLGSILRASGKKVGLITSPHPSTITERWEINGRPIPKNNFVKLVEQIRPALQKYLEISPYDFPSFFEIITTLGLLYFAQNNIEWAVVEVGLGGRNDSTNIIPKKDLAIITNIGLDHLDLIGPTKKEVAYEKAGIIKKRCQVLTAEEDKKILEIIKKEAIKNQAQIKCLKIFSLSSAAKASGMKPRLHNPLKNIQTLNLYYQINKENLGSTNFAYHDDNYLLPIIGRHQIKNAILAIEAASVLGIEKKDIKKGLAQTKFPICMEIVSNNPLIILDGAHNPDKMKTTVETTKWLMQQKPNYQWHLIIGFSGDKDIDTMLKQLAALNPASIICTRSTSNPFRKVADPKILAIKIKKLLPKTKIKIFLEPQEALLSLKNKTGNNATLVTGSIFLSWELTKNFH